MYIIDWEGRGEMYVDEIIERMNDKRYICLADFVFLIRRSSL